MREVLRHCGNAVEFVGRDLVAVFISGFVQLVKNGIDFAVIKQGIVRVHTGLERPADLRGDSEA